MIVDWTSCLDKDSGIPTLGCLPVIFNNIIIAAVSFAGIVAVFFIIMSAIKLVTSGGDAKQVDAARKSLSFALIGLVLVFLSFGIINIISQVTKVDCIKRFGFDCPSPTP